MRKKVYKTKVLGFGGIVQVTECLPSNHELLGLIPSSTRENKKQKTVFLRGIEQF
jgi:hypothetical protein